jgi:hypothetical protein
MGVKILETEIFDNAMPDENGCIQPSEISVGVTIEHNGERYTLDFQTTTTHDYGAFSSILESYEGNSDHSNLSDTFEDEEQFNEFLREIKMQANPEQVWKSYVDDNYDCDLGNFGGMDANSEINKATKKL